MMGHDELVRDLADVAGWLLVRHPDARRLSVAASLVRPPAGRDLGLVFVDAEPEAEDHAVMVWRQEAVAALRALGYRTGVRPWDYLYIAESPAAHELSAHRRLMAWTRVEAALAAARGRVDPPTPGA